MLEDVQTKWYGEAPPLGTPRTSPLKTAWAIQHRNEKRALPDWAYIYDDAQRIEIWSTIEEALRHVRIRRACGKRKCDKYRAVEMQFVYVADKLVGYRKLAANVSKSNTPSFSAWQREKQQREIRKQAYKDKHRVRVEAAAHETKF